jgi:hypothetical protein
MSAFDYPADTTLVDENKKPMMPWSATFSRWHSLILTIQDSGTTADRPTSNLFIGRQYFDTTLNKPVFLSAVKPTVWRDAAGTVV